MTDARSTQVAMEVVDTATPSAHATQSAIEIVTTSQALPLYGRATQVAIEIIARVPHTLPASGAILLVGIQ